MLCRTEETGDLEALRTREANHILWREGEDNMGEFVMELWAFMKERKKFWLLPIVIVLLLLGFLIILTQGSAVAPFIYTLF